MGLSAYRVAAVQMDIIPGTMERNRDHATELAGQAISLGARLVVFPELADIDMVEDAYALASPAPGPFTAPFERLAERHGVHIVIGMARRTGEGLYNSAVFIGPGGIVGIYDKVHVWAGDWDAIGNRWAEDPRRIEPNNYLPGREFKVFAVDGVNVGALICYDGMFPESWQCNRLLAADMVVWPTNRGNYEDVDVPALARYFQLNVVAVNRFGRSSYWCQGDSQVVDAHGRVLAHAYNGEAVLVADLNLESSRRWRRSLPYLRDRRPDIYEKILARTPPEEMAPGIPSSQVTPLWRPRR